MKGKKLAAKIMLGLLLATPYGFAEAAETMGSIENATTIENSVEIKADKYVTFKDSKGEVIGTSTFSVWAQGNTTEGTIEEIKLLGNEITINADSYSYDETRAVWANTNGSVTLGNGNSVITVNATGNSPMAMTAMGTNSKLIVNADTLTVNVDTEYGWGIHAQNNTQTETAPDTAASVNITANNITINSTDLGISAFSNGQMNINGNLVVNADHAIDTRGNATININTDGAHTTVLNGDIVFETPNTPSDPQNSGNLINSNVNINFSGAESSFNGSAYKTYPDSGVEGDYMIDHNDNNHYGNVTDFNLTFDNGAAWNMTNDSFVNDVTLSNGGVINVQENAERFNADEAEMNDGVINLQGDNQEVNVTTLTGDNGTFAVNSVNSKVNVTTNNSTGLTLNGSSNVTNSFDVNNVNKGMQDLADVMNITSGNKDITVTAAEGDILGEITAQTDKDGNVVADSVKQGENVKNAGITELANVAFMAWRAENDEMHQRMGELRSSNGEAGIWARMKRGESESGDLDITNQYNTYQLGYDEKVGDSNWYIGGAISRTEGKSSFANGSGENQSTGFTVYGTYVGDDGQYVDLSAKYARLDNEFDVFDRAGMEVNGDYRNNGYAFSAEYGKRIEAGNDFWVEPQVQLTYGHLSSANYTASNDVKAAQDAMNSVVGRVGFAAGKDISAGNVYVKASYLYDFDGDTSVTMTKGGQSATYEQDLGGGWFEFGIGTNINISKTSHLYFDVEKAVGGEIDTPWQWNAGVRFDF